MVSRVIAVALSGVVVLGLSGCFQNPIEAAIENATEQAVEQAIEGAGEASGVDVDLGGDVALPDSWPASVPVPEGEIISALSQDDFQTLLITVANEEAGIAGAEANKAAGFEVVFEQNVEGMRSWQLDSADLSVNYSVFSDGETVTVTMMVGPKVS